MHAWADAPAPFTTTFISLIDLPLISRAFIRAAVVMIAVPCWSSWKTGISNISLSFCSIIKQSGFDARAPKLPIPKIAEPLLITATKFPLLV